MSRFTTEFPGAPRWCFGVLAVVALLCGLPAVASATTICVDNTLGCDDSTATPATSCSPGPTYCTIQAAEDDAVSGDSITVAAGIGPYLGVFIDTSNLALKCAKAGIDARYRTTVGETVISDPNGPIQICANNVTVDGCTIQDADMTGGFFAGIWTNPGFCTAPDGGYTIINNIIQNNVQGIFPNSTGVNPTLIQFNLIQNNNNAGPAAGNGIYSEFGLSNATIDANKFVGHTNSDVILVGTQSGIAISNNAIGFRVVLASTSSSSITGNFSYGSTSSGTIRLFGGNSGITVSGNALLNGVRGIRIDDVGIAPNSSITINDNCIAGNSTAGLEVETAGYSGGPGSLDAMDNWWGASDGPSGTGPGSGDAIVDPDAVVDFSNFKTAPAAACPACVAPDLCATGPPPPGCGPSGSSCFCTQPVGGVPGQGQCADIVPDCNVLTGCATDADCTDPGFPACVVTACGPPIGGITPDVCPAPRCLPSQCTVATTTSSTTSTTESTTSTTESTTSTTESTTSTTESTTSTTESTTSTTESTTSTTESTTSTTESTTTTSTTSTTTTTVVADLNVTRAVIERQTGPTASNGNIRVNGDFNTPPNFVSPPAFTIRVQDSGTLDVSHTFTTCTSGLGGRLRCREDVGPSQFKIYFLPLRSTPSVYQFRVRWRRMAIDSPFTAPVTMTLTHDSTVIRADTIFDCRQRNSGLNCREF